MIGYRCASVVQARRVEGGLELLVVHAGIPGEHDEDAATVHEKREGCCPSIRPAREMEILKLQQFLEMKMILVEFNQSVVFHFAEFF